MGIGRISIPKLGNRSEIGRILLVCSHAQGLVRFQVLRWLGVGCVSLVMFSGPWYFFTDPFYTTRTSVIFPPSLPKTIFHMWNQCIVREGGGMAWRWFWKVIIRKGKDRSSLSAQQTLHSKFQSTTIFCRCGPFQQLSPYEILRLSHDFWGLLLWDTWMVFCF